MNKIEEWLDNNSLSIDIWNRKYRYANESHESFFNRISLGDEKLKQLILDKKFLFGGRMLANLNTNAPGVTYSNCYVLSVEDSIENIYDCCGKIARTYSYGGGCGIDISKLRPCGAFVNNSARETSGAVSFMQTFDIVTEVIGQNNRRGALMISMDVRHPDIESFIDVKANTDSITHANISVRVNDEFMQAVQNDEDYLLHWPCDITINKDELDNLEYDTLTPILTQCGFVYLKKVKAKKLFEKLAYNNWNYAEPGILYWDRISNWHMMAQDPQFAFAGVNPCAEEPLVNGGACLLGSINLSAYVINGYFDYKSLMSDIPTIVNAMNIVQEENIKLHPLDIQKEAASKYKQIGLGIMGLADTFIKMKIAYGSEESFKLVKCIMQTILVESYKASCDYNDKHGNGLNRFPYLKESPFYNQMIKPYLTPEYKTKFPFNSQLLTIAPTGTISTMLNISGGAEPIFALYYERTTKSLHDKDVKYKVYPKIIQEYMEENQCTEENLPNYITMSMSDKLNVEQRVAMQALLQQYIDASISSTVNLPKETTVQTVYDIYMNAWKQGLKGITIFRNGCARTAILSTSTTEDIDSITTSLAPKRPKVLPANFTKIKVNGGYYWIFVGLLDSKPYEIFIVPSTDSSISDHIGTITKIKKAHYRFESDFIKIENIAMEQDDYKNITLNVSLALRHGIPIKYIVHTVKKANSNIVSVNSAICRVLNKYTDKEITTELCPECGEPLIRENGCLHCHCGYSKCLTIKSYTYEIKN